MPLHETASAGPIPSRDTTTSTFLVFNPPKTVSSPCPAESGAYSRTSSLPLLTTLNGGRGVMQSG